MMIDPSKKPDTLKNRLLVNVLGIPSLLGIIWLGGVAYLALISAIIVLGIREYLAMLELNGMTPRPWPLFAAGLALLGAVAEHAGVLALGLFPPLAESAILILVLLILALQTIEVLKSPPMAWLSLSAHVAGFIWISVFASTFILIRETTLTTVAGPAVDTGFRLTLALFVSVWICDSSAYIFGKRYGKAKLLPKVSPKKTVVGTVSGIIGATIVMLVVHSFGWLAGFTFSDAVALGLIAGVLGQLGDFVESRLKRDMGVKDTGALLPGHGGILDRFDSLLFVMPISYLYISVFIL